MRSLDERPQIYMYLPVLQRYAPDETLIGRSTGDPRALVSPLRAIVQQIDPALPLFNVRTMSQQVGGSLLPRRIAAGGAAIVGLLALLLAMIGLYGVVSYSVSRRTQEIGLRIALGASAADVRRMIVSGALGSVLVGAAVGLAAAFGATRFLRALLYGVSPLDPMTFIVVPLMLLVVAALASYLPARRATRIDPMLALRAE
jgi:ABC-type antimicrobial peptide transport system permease subunit